jgi:hypothetical protein
MTAIRRILSLIVLTVSVIAGASVPAWATFRDAVTIVTTVPTATVAPPTNVSSAGSWCNNGVLSASFSWSPSPSRGVSGYSVRTYQADGTSTAFAETDAATTAVTGVYPSHGQSATVALTVTTRTSYGWTKESAQVQVPPC